ncbi:MAG: polyribonucleotide nucleotidyltransferase [Qipengyuania citrea]|jgi:polyribonucleotide nucleotidyltransferase|uniref:polyribonucleotide nucleotidyltransferase n=1 Tax=Erythrobacteraceae TaxID=335929 RepID=UPI0007BADAA0|nr:MULTISPECIES: polyribonucleotide nucleotidyltransferase [unclassified Erythrobacter]RZP18919.1 MAG: polyribonucleotide nucleotidyltransferase [Erythrobacter sp.]KZX91369.1 polyribonucleotide nucleotidyltransferase [Erythrobacter sp. HI0019]KZY10300.1 polyribonucleotide nucleotidyltransferase [Erythrobacter sp. HI0028]KZY90398.1 polyribonucleotide nucleotidyltransferase [Erythrobacter sp. HI0074]KZZ06395.1 polyribonucleotide nucleotidyltransferase [Erythrobacter sp. HI0077]|tara:strand:- start:210 stop:2486 length:2277 start_codon:yes stop_codon:yes gene_type:complete
MFDTKTVSLEWGGKTLTLETGRIARQADGAVLATYGETVVLCAVTAAKSVREGQDFFPLTVHYQEKFSAAGRIPGGFFKREGRATEKETLTSRLIDRPVRPLFPEGFYNEINVICQVLSYDGETEPDIVAMIAASAALTISGVPFMGPIGAARVGFRNGEYELNPSLESALDEEGRLDLVVAATQDAVMMVESEAKELTEEEMLGAVMFAHEESRKVIGAIVDLAEQAAKEPWEIDTSDDTSAIKEKLRGIVGDDIAAAYKLTDKSARSDALNDARAKAKEAFAEEEAQTQMVANKAVKKLEAEIVRGAILKDGQRIDGRKLDQVRPIEAMVGLLPRTHGSALFTRGETQAICTTTLGTKDAEQMIDGLEGLSYNNFMLHYNFPPYSVGEVGRFGFTSRRETGHGKLAWRALHPVLPKHEDFPYTIRILSDITESNGSSSMATVCGGCLSMMDAGVPIERPVSGIAMGLILEGDDFAVLSDILGDEDHLGDMDFKVAGSEKGITSLQMDIKVAGITQEIMKTALEQAKGGRAHILGEMNKALTGARTEVSKHAPRIETMQIDKSKIRDVIGTGGKVIREIVAETGAKVDIDDEGVIKISSSNADEIEAARKWIEGIVEEAEVGKIYNGKVVNIVDFGAFVNFMGGKDGLVHVSEMKNERVEKPTDVVSEGQEVKVKVLEIDQRGKVRLSMRVVDQETGEELEDTRPAREPRGDRGPRGGGGGRGGDRRGGRGGPRRDRDGGGNKDGGGEAHVPDFLKD